MRKLILAAALLITSVAWAEPRDKVAARALFDEGRRLVKEGKVDEACARFEASLAVEPLLGTRLNLAECHRLQGKTATAWEEFREAAALAARSGDERETFARDRAAELDKIQARLTIQLSPGSEVTGLLIKHAGVTVRRALVGVAVPVDPGTHIIEATAPGKTAWATQVEVGPAAAITVDVPVLGEPTRYPVMPAPTKAARPMVQTAQPEPIVTNGEAPGRSRRTIGLITGGVGIASVGIGLVFGLKAKSSWADAQNGHCDSSGHCIDQAGLDLLGSAHSSATVSTIAVGVGAAAIVGGIVLFVTAPRARPAERSARVWITPALERGLVSATVGMEL
jgi:hypothetical protein